VLHGEADAGGVLVELSSSAPIHTYVGEALEAVHQLPVDGGWLKALRRDQPKSSVRGSMDAKQRPLAVTKRIQW
jgi:hypothetical protein